MAAAGGRGGGDGCGGNAEMASDGCNGKDDREAALVAARVEPSNELILATPISQWVSPVRAASAGRGSACSGYMAEVAPKQGDGPRRCVFSSTSRSAQKRQGFTARDNECISYYLTHYPPKAFKIVSAKQKVRTSYVYTMINHLTTAPPARLHNCITVTIGDTLTSL